MKCSDCGAQVRPIVALDIDGTMADYHGAFIQFAEMWLGHQLLAPRTWSGVGEFSEFLGLDRATYRQMKLAFRAGGFKRWMPETLNVNRLTRTLAQAGAEVWITTTRPWQRMDNVDPDTKEWLKRHGADFKHLIFDEDKYGMLVDLVNPNRIVMVLDDEEDQRDRCAGLRLPFVLRRNRWNTGINHDWTLSDEQAIIELAVERIGMHDALRQ